MAGTIITKKTNNAQGGGTLWSPNLKQMMRSISLDTAGQTEAFT